MCPLWAHIFEHLIPHWHLFEEVTELSGPLLRENMSMRLGFEVLHLAPHPVLPLRFLCVDENMIRQLPDPVTTVALCFRIIHL